jgi:hypothetical protein
LNFRAVFIAPVIGTGLIVSAYVINSKVKTNEVENRRKEARKVLHETDRPPPLSVFTRVAVITRDRSISRRKSCAQWLGLT